MKLSFTNTPILRWHDPVKLVYFLILNKTIRAKLRVYTKKLRINNKIDIINNKTVTILQYLVLDTKFKVFLKLSKLSRSLLNLYLSLSLS